MIIVLKNNNFEKTYNNKGLTFCYIFGVNAFFNLNTLYSNFFILISKSHDRF